MPSNNQAPDKAAKFKKFFLRKRIIIPLSVFLFIVICYITFVFSNIPFIKYCREIYIETAMTTGDHQWLATAFIPKNVIDNVMAGKTGVSDDVGNMDKLKPKPVDTSGTVDTSDPTVTTDKNGTEEITPPATDEKPEDILGQKDLKVGEKDYAGYEVLINDIEQGIVVSEIVGSTPLGTYRGKIMLIDDPSRVYLGSTPTKGVEGLRIKDMMAHHGAIAGINASGFPDPGGSGNGGTVIGLSYSEDKFWGEAVSYYGSVLITSDDYLVVGNVKEWEKYDIRAGIQFGPVLIADGEACIEGSGGYGIQPRTAIGQREDGVIVFLIIDGRQITWSIGCTVEDMIEVLLKYGVVNAACCDGGSSSVMAYDGEVITKNSSANPTYGRRLPNAWLVKPKTVED